MDYCILICVMFIGATYLLKTEAEILPWMARDMMEVENIPKILQHLKETRHKRNAPSEGGSQCCQHGDEKKSQSNIPRRTVVHHYHHHYYYCCPCIPQEVRHKQNIPHAGHQRAPHPQAGSPKASVSCSHDTSGTVSCSVTGGPSPHTSGSGAGTEKPQAPNANGVFGISMAIGDPIGKEFLDFISKNFVKKDSPGQPNECKSGLDNFNDPVCKEFFNFFSKNFVRKPQHQTPAPSQAQTQSPNPTQAQKQAHTNDFKNLNEIKNLFSSLKDEMKNTFSMAKRMENDITGFF